MCLGEALRRVILLRYNKSDSEFTSLCRVYPFYNIFRLRPESRRCNRNCTATKDPGMNGAFYSWCFNQFQKLNEKRLKKFYLG